MDPKQTQRIYNIKITNLEHALVGTSNCQIHVPWILNWVENQPVKNISWILCQSQRLTHCHFWAVFGANLTQKFQ